MKFIAPLALSASTFSAAALGAVIPQEPLGPSIVQNTQQPKWLIELAPYTTRWVTEEEKWALKLVSRPPCPRYNTHLANHPPGRTASTSSTSPTSSNPGTMARSTPSASCTTPKK